MFVLSPGMTPAEAAAALDRWLEWRVSPAWKPPPLPPPVPPPPPDPNSPIALARARLAARLTAEQVVAVPR
jgi:hypothetical protein